MSKCRIYIILIMSCFFFRCNKDEATLLTGDIVGCIQAYDENYYSLSDKSGFIVTLSNDSTSFQTTSDENGLFTFENIMYGNYLIDLVKEDYIKSYSNYNLHHLGGYSPTSLRYDIYEVPGFALVIDSVDYDHKNWGLQLFGRISGNEGKPRYNSYDIRCFFNDSPDVSKDNFSSVEGGHIYVSEEDSTLIYGGIFWWSLYWQQSDTVYMCVYPQAFGQNELEFYYGSLGKPSNVVGFINEP